MGVEISSTMVTQSCSSIVRASLSGYKTSGYSRRYMETNIYLVMWNVAWEGSDVMSVHRTKKGARKEANKLAREDGFKQTVGFDEWMKNDQSITIEEFDLRN